MALEHQGLRGEQQGADRDVDAGDQPERHPPPGTRPEEHGAECGKPQQEEGGETTASRNPLQAGFGQGGGDEFGVAAAGDQHAAGVGAHGPLVDHGGGSGARGGKRDRRAGAVCRLTEAEGDTDGIVGVQARRERHERLVAVGAGVHHLVVHAGLPELHAGGQLEAQCLAATRLHEIAGLGHDLAVARDLAGQLREIDHLVHGLALRVPLDAELEVERPGRVLVNRERGRTGEQAKLRGQLERFELEQAAFGFADLGFHLPRADDLHVSTLCLHVEGPHLAGLDRAPAGAHRLLEGEQQRRGAEHGLVERDDHLVAFAPPVAADVLPHDVDVAGGRRHFDPPFTRRRADDKIVEQHAAVDDALFERIEVKDVGLHALAERLDAHLGRPVRLAQAPRLLEPGGLPREIAQRHLDETVGLCRHEPVAGCRHRTDIPAHGLGAGEAQRRQPPVARCGGLVFLEAELEQLPALDRAAEENFQRTVAVRGAGLGRVVGEVVAGDRDDRVVRGNLEGPVAQRGLAHVEFEAGVDDPVGLRQFVGRDGGNADLGLDLRGEDAVTITRRREPVDEDLARPVLDRRAGELAGGELHHARDVGDLQAHGAAVGDPHEAGVAHAALGREAQRLGPHGKAAELGLAAHHEGTFRFHRPAEPHFEDASGGGGDAVGEDLPADDIGAVHTEDFTPAVEAAAHAAELALQDAEGNFRRLAEEARAEPHIGLFETGEGQRALGGLRCVFPPQRDQAAAGQETLPALGGGGRDDGRDGLEADVRPQPLELQRHHGAGRHEELEPAPVAGFVDRRGKGKLHRERPGALTDEVVDEFIVAGLDEFGMPAIAGGLLAESGRPREQP